VTSGKTNPLVFDTNHDGISDGVKVNNGRDALGYDADQDGIPNAIDPDDTVPSWAPALKVFSNDYAKRMEVSFLDVLVPLNAVSVQAHYNASGQDKVLSSTYQSGTTWSVNPTEHTGEAGTTQFPDSLLVHRPKAATWTVPYGPFSASVP
jgi:hypothetical protein